MSNVVITGCSSGFGLLSAITFAEHGHCVYATMRDPRKADALHAAADAAGVAVNVSALDVCSTESVNDAIAQIAANGTIDVLVNNAGIELFGSVHLLSDDEMLRQLDTNVVGLVRVCRAVVPHMLASVDPDGVACGGTIVNVGSVAGLVGAPYSGMYAASKHAVEALSEAMHFELSQRGIRVRVVEPGQFATNLGSNSMTATAMLPGTDEHDRFTRFRGAMRSLVNGEPAPAQRVADVIYQAATEVPGQLRYPVGGDTELIIATKSSMPFEAFDTTMRAALNWFD